jgi:hypothetical protein
MTAQPNTTPVKQTKTDLLGIQIQTTSHCNGRCVICPYLESWHAQHPGDMDDELFSSIVDQIKRIHVRKLCPYLENEPLMDKKIFDRLKVMRDSCSYDMIEISTNALLLNRDRAEQLIDILAPVRHEIWISFHGIDKDTYEELMQIPFEKTLSNVVNFLKMCDEKQAPIRPVLRGAGLPKVTRWRKSKFFSKRQYHKFWEDTFVEHGIRIRPRIDFFRYHDRAANITRKDLCVGKGPRRDLAKMNCPRVDNWLHFLYNGEMILCCMDYHRETVFGNIKTQSLDGILSGEPFARLRGQALGELPSPDDFICRRCFSPGG